MYEQLLSSSKNHIMKSPQCTYLLNNALIQLPLNSMPNHKTSSALLIEVVNSCDCACWIAVQVEGAL